MMEIDGGKLGLIWIVPFAGLLLSIAAAPLVSREFWHRHFASVSLFWALTAIVPMGLVFGAEALLGAMLHTLVLDYLPFIILLTALYTVAGGIRLTGTLHGTPAVNTLLLLIGSSLASIMGTTGAAMLLVRPLIRANRRRRQNTHVFVFFIFLVANIGGALTPLGDPPLLIGFLQGVPFFWPTVHLLLPTLFSVVMLLGVFYVLDRHYHRRGWHDTTDPIEEIERLGVDGKVNLPLLATVPAIVFAMGATRDMLPTWEWHHLHVNASTIAGCAALMAVAIASLRLTRPGVRHANDFTWHPMAEVAVVFAAIFITIVPELAMLRAGQQGAMAPLLTLVAPEGQPIDAIYFWMTGILSSMLDNAPTYLVFFNLAGGDAAMLTGALARTLVAISLGAVMMGANTYIGNAPNFMVKAICEERGIAMPSFFGFIGWAVVFLFPLYCLLTLIFFR